MNNPNPFVPQGSLLEQKNKQRARVKVAVFSIFGFNILLMSFFLLQGCNKKDASTDSSTLANSPATDTNLPDTNTVQPLPPMGTSTVATAATSNLPPVAPAPPPPVVETPATQEYVVAKGDSFYTIAKKYHVKMKDLETANPTALPTKLKVGQKLQIPGGTGVAGAADSNGGAMTEAGGESYTVKSGDSLTKISKQFGITVKALRAANSLKTDKIKVGQKLKVPSKSATADIAAPATTTSFPPPSPTTVTSAPAPMPGTGR